MGLYEEIPPPSIGSGGGSGGGNSFTTIQPDTGTAPVASGPTDTLTLTSTDLAISGNSGTDTITYALATKYQHAIIREFCGFIENPLNKKYIITNAAVTSGTINSAWLETLSGTLTASIKINAVNVTSLSAVAVSSTGANTNATGANTFVANDTITLTVTSISTPSDFNFTIKWTVS